MRLYPFIKELRLLLPDYRIKQRRTEYNQLYALVCLPNCINELRLLYNRYYLIWDFDDFQGFYYINDLDYLSKELAQFLTGELCVISLYIQDKHIESFMTDSSLISIDYLKKEIFNIVNIDLNQKNFGSGYVKISYADSDNDKLLEFGYNCNYIDSL